MIPLLINKATAAAKLQIAVAIPDAEFNKLVEEAQTLDLKPEMPERFFYDLLKNKADTEWKKIIDGGDYEWTPDGETTPITCYHHGLAHVLSYFYYARLAMSANAVSTSHGFVTKNTPQSTPITLEEKKNIYYKKREEANSFLDDTIKFIIRNKSNYPSWKYYYNNDYVNGDPESENCPIGWNSNYPQDHYMNQNLTTRNRSTRGGGATRVIQ